MSRLTRRDLLKAGAGSAALVAGAAAAPVAARTAAPRGEAGKDRWILALNTSTIRPARLEEKIKATAEAGYDAIELWISEIDNWEKGGQPVADLRKRLEDAGLRVPNVISIWNAMPASDEEKDKQMDEFKRKMSQARKVGAGSIAALPTPDRPDIDIPWAAARYRELVDAGREIGIRVALEFIGLFRGIHTLGQAVAIAVEADRPEACIVADTFHVYRGGSSFTGVRHLDGRLFSIWHVNDAPKEPPRTEQRDEHRVYPGDGILPLPALLKDLWAQGFKGPLSLELFMRDEWKKPAAEVAKRGIETMRRVIAASGVGA